MSGRDIQKRETKKPRKDAKAKVIQKLGLEPVEVELVKKVKRKGEAEEP